MPQKMKNNSKDVNVKNDSNINATQKNDVTLNLNKKKKEKHDSTIAIKADTNDLTTSIKLEPEKTFPILPIVHSNFFGKKTITNKTKAGDIIENKDAKPIESTVIEKYEWEKKLQRIPVNPNNCNFIETPLICQSNEREKKLSSIPSQFIGAPDPTDFKGVPTLRVPYSYFFEEDKAAKEKAL